MIEVVKTSTEKRRARQHRYYLKNVARRAAWYKAYRKSFPEIIKFKHIKTNYGINLDQYHAFLEQQNERCPICLGAIQPLHTNTVVDHNHETGKVRGLLCKGCNTAIGLLDDDPTKVNRALNYLRSA